MNAVSLAKRTRFMRGGLRAESDSLAKRSNQTSKPDLRVCLGCLFALRRAGLNSVCHFAEELIIITFSSTGPLQTNLFCNQIYYSIPLHISKLSSTLNQSINQVHEPTTQINKTQAFKLIKLINQ